MEFGVVAECGGGDVFEERRLAGLGWADDECSLAAADGAEEVYEAAGGGAAGVFEGDAGLGIYAGEIFEGGAICVFGGWAALDGEEGLDDGACGAAAALAAASFFALADFDGDHEASAQGVLLPDVFWDEWIVVIEDDPPAFEPAHARLGGLGPLDDAREGCHV